MLWKGFQKPKRLEVEQETPDRHLREVLRPAVRARIRHDHRQRPAPDPALLDRRRGDHRGEDRGRACTSSRSIPGVVEDTTDIILNLKQIPFRIHSDHPETLTLNAEGPGHGHRRAISRSTANVRSWIRTGRSRRFPRKASISMEMRLKRGRGYVTADRTSTRIWGSAIIPLDSVHSPVRKVNYTVEDARLGQTTDYDKLILEVWTNGACIPRTRSPGRQAAQGPHGDLHQLRGGARGRAGLPDQRGRAADANSSAARWTSWSSRCAPTTA